MRQQLGRLSRGLAVRFGVVLTAAMLSLAGLAFAQEATVKKEEPKAKTETPAQEKGEAGGAAKQDAPKEEPKKPESTPPKQDPPASGTKKESAEPKPESAPAKKKTGTRGPGSQQRPADPKAAEQKPAEGTPAVEERDRRVQELEKKLQELIKEVESLRTPPSAPAKSVVRSNGANGMMPEGLLEAHWLKSINWRSLGPANMGGRITDIAVCDSDPSTFWVATASGGLLKTTNNGVTFQHQFDRETTVSIGAVAVAPSDQNVVWVGTGEDNPRNSVSFGDGAYKSIDGGKTWKNMGLKKTYQVGHIIIHPKDPNTVYVGALGRLYGTNEERGVFKTTNGGESWEKVLYVDDKTGVIDMVMHPTDPNTLIAALWERQRDGFDSWPGNDVPKADGYDGYDPIKKWGPGSGLYKTSDAGKSWKKLSAGLPTSHMGRIGLDWYRKDPNVVFAVIDCADIGKGPQAIPVYLGVVGQDSDGKARVTQVLPDSPAAKAGVAVGDVITAVGDTEIKEFDQVLDAVRTKRAGQKVTVKTRRGEESKDFEIALASRPGGGGGPGGGGPGGFGGGAAGGAWLGAFGEDREGKPTFANVLPESPAAKAGIQEGDLLVAVAGKSITEFNQLTEQVRGGQPDDKLLVKIRRGEETKELEVTLEQRPAGGFGGFGGRGGGSPTDAYLGIQGEDAEGGGAKMTRITDEGPAEKAGIESNDVIKAIDGKNVASYEAFTEELRSRKPGDKIKITIVRGKETKEIEATLETRPGGPTRTRPHLANLGGQNPNNQDLQGSKGHLYGGVYRSADGGETWTRVNSLNARPMYFSVIRVDPNDDKNVYVLGVSEYRSSNGGLTFTGDFGRGVHSDGHALWVDPRDGRHMLIGVDGGTYATYDRGANWDHLNTMAIGQFYHVAIGPKAPYWVFGGLQDNGSWGGPSLSKNGSGAINEDWISVGGGDGFTCRVDPNDPDLVYSTSQDGNMSRRNLKTGERASIRPQRQRGQPGFRFNWNPPFILSSHNSKIFYCAGNFVFCSLDRGNNLQAISPEITLTKRGSATAVAESPRNSNVLYAGTDDGALWITRDGGKEWKEISKNVGLTAPRWVSTIEPSRFEEGRVYVCFDGHRSDDDDPLVFVSEDFGQTWKTLRSNLPWGSTRCLREDLVNQNLLYLGTEFGVWCSIDRGQYWNRLNNNLPTVAVHEIAIHPANGEIVAATHGRSLWSAEITPLRQLKVGELRDKIALYQPSSAIRWQSEPSRGRTNRRFVGTNPPSGAQLYYSLPRKAERVSIKIVDIDGTTIRELRGPTDAGLQRVSWDLARVTQPAGGQGGGPGGAGFQGRRGGGPTRTATGEAATSTASAQRTETAQAGSGAATVRAGEGQGPAAGGTTGQAPGGATQRGGPGGGFAGFAGGGFGGGRPVPAGTYRVVLTVDGQEFAQTVRVELDPAAPANVVIGEDDQRSDWDNDE